MPWAAASPFVHDAVVVSDDDIRAAQRALWSGLRLVAEPGGAAAMAAILSGAYVPEPEERVVVVVCGSNTDPNLVDGAGSGDGVEQHAVLGPAGGLAREVEVLEVGVGLAVGHRAPGSAG